MRRSDALRHTLEALTIVYNDGDEVPVQFGSPSRAIPEGNNGPEGLCHEDTVAVSPNVRDELGRDLSGPQELRCIANILSHEIEHLRESDLTSKEDFMDEYDDHPQFAGAVINILEDQYIDFTRTQRLRGLRKAQAFVVESLMQNHHRWPRVDNIENRPKAMMETLRQVAFAGYAKGIQSAGDDLREFIGRVRPLIDRVRREDDQAARKDIAHQVMSVALEYLPDREDVEIPDECAVCGDREPVVIVPLLGPVCEECAPSGHGPGDGRQNAERTDDHDDADGGGGIPEPLPDADADGPGESDDGGAGDAGDEGYGDGDGDAVPTPGDELAEGDARPDDQSPIADSQVDGRDIDPREWDWLDLDGHEGHTVSIVGDDTEV